MAPLERLALAVTAMRCVPSAKTFAKRRFVAASQAYPPEIWAFLSGTKWSTSSLLAVITVVLVKAPHHWPVAT